jgi:gliding motility-associated protein GldM
MAPKILINSFTSMVLLIACIAIWWITNLTYTFLSKLIDPLTLVSGRIIYCAICSFVLSQIVIFFYVHKKHDFYWRSILTSVLTGLLIYLSVNGIQAGYSSIMSPALEVTSSKPKLSTIISAQSWMPPLSMRAQAGQFETQIAALEERHGQLINKIDSINNQADSGLEIDSVFMIVIPSSRKIPNGSKYKAKVVLAASLPDSLIQNVTVNEVPLTAINSVAYHEEIGKGKSSSHTLDYLAVVKLNDQMVDVKTTEYYETFSPYIEVSSAVHYTLYVNCGNELTFKVPELGRNFRPSFTVTGGTYQPNKGAGSIIVVPNAQQVIVSVHNSGTRIGQKMFQVRRVPPPIIRIYSQGKEINAIVSRQATKLDIRVMPDQQFAATLPKDAQYKVEKCEVSLISKCVTKNIVNGSNMVNVSFLAKTSRPGDLLKIEIQEVLRRNFRGDIETVRMFSPQIFAFTIK